jgi:hypothetical protein
MWRNFIVRYDKPSVADRTYARNVVHRLFVYSGEAADLDNLPEDAQRRLEKATELLRVATGNWRLLIFTHHCKLGCCVSKQDRLFQDIDGLFILHSYRLHTLFIDASHNYRNLVEE